MTKEIAKIIKIAMIEHELNQKQLAKLIGVTPPVISDLLLYGKGSNKTLKKIAIALDLDYRELLKI